MQDLAEQAARSQQSSDDVTNTTSLTSLTSHSNGLSVSAAASAVIALGPAATAANSSPVGSTPRATAGDAAGSSHADGTGPMVQQGFAGAAVGGQADGGTPEAFGSRWASGPAARNLQEGFAAQAEAGATTPYYTPVVRSRATSIADE